MASRAIPCLRSCRATKKERESICEYLKISKHDKRMKNFLGYIDFKLKANSMNHYLALPSIVKNQKSFNAFVGPRRYFSMKSKTLGSCCFTKNLKISKIRKRK